jgi:hypothetical protein
LRRRQNEFWECKKLVETERAEWIIDLTNYQAKADQDTVWESKLERILQTIEKMQHIGK